MENNDQIDWKARYFELLKRFEALEAEVKELKEKLGSNSRNSSKPPSQDPFRPKRTSKPTGRKRGAQPGHPGHSRKPVPPDQVTKMIDIRPESCSNCKSDKFSNEPIAIELRQVVELPEIRAEITQYNIHTCRCDKCGKHVRGKVPAEAERCFGPRLMGFMTMLAGEGHLSKRKIRSITGHLGIRISIGAITNVHKLATDLLEKPHQEIKQRVLKEANVNVDESSWYLRNKRCWVWVGATSKATFFQINAGRSRAAFEEIFADFKNTLTSDRYSAYNKYEGSKQSCLSHILRGLTKMSEREGVDGVFGRILEDQMKELFGCWSRSKTLNVSRSKLREWCLPYVENIKTALLTIVSVNETSEKSQRFCNNLLDKFETLWTFLEEEGVEPTNNLAERGLRPLVIVRKLSNGSQSDWGCRFTERLMTIVCTFKQQSRNVLEYLVKLFDCYTKAEKARPIFG